MSKKHFKALAEELKAALELNKDNQAARQAVERVVEGIAKVCQRDNPAFDRGASSMRVDMTQTKIN